MLISGFVLTHTLPDEAVPWLKRAAELFDELVLFIDEERAQPGVHGSARRTGPKVFSSHAASLYASDFGGMIACCAGEWIVRLDWDEELSPEWHDPGMREVLAATAFSHFWCPRRWLTSPTSYLASEPWWPDFQVRVMRNRPRDITFRSRPHEMTAVKGAGASLRTLAIHHHDLWLSPRHARAAKAERYRLERADLDVGYFYCFEDLPRKPIPLPMPAAVDPAKEVLVMEALRATDAALVRLHGEGLPRTAARRQPFWFKIVITNNTAHTLRSAAPFPVVTCHHWLRADRVMAAFEGYRSAILPGIAPGASASIESFAVAPDSSGEFVLQLALLQEHVFWFETADPAIVQEFSITVE